jgi:hypothetical protein
VFLGDIAPVARDLSELRLGVKIFSAAVLVCGTGILPVSSFFDFGDRLEACPTLAAARREDTKENQ